LENGRISPKRREFCFIFFGVAGQVEKITSINYIKRMLFLFVSVHKSDAFLSTGFQQK